jgi:hypothetical protein
LLSTISGDAGGAIRVDGLRDEQDQEQFVDVINTKDYFVAIDIISTPAYKQQAIDEKP